ncbi:hypothetical protein GCM10010358_05990 [Streptomyces minutiscleroticus]|uniref:Uncharacterized protein n=1 Tax=Streptomyces minutiscleroticus TaxID=68238 RepID=A0A918KAY6_9ACTN|nr:hypothetical protein GCM10010358_05990 [Streptomyces minutiscleroticus]
MPTTVHAARRTACSLRPVLSMEATVRPGTDTTVRALARAAGTLAGTAGAFRGTAFR